MPSDKPSPPNRSIAHLTLEEYRTIVEHAHEGMWTIDTAGVTQFVNPRMAQMLGYVPDEMVGSSVYDFMYETDRDEARGHHATRWRGISERYEFRFQRRDGSELWTMVSATPLRNENEEIIGGLDLVTDITAAKQAKETLRESEERYREFVDRATFGIYRSTVEGRFASVNPALVRMLGYGSEQELYDLDMANDLYVDPNDRALLMESYRDADRVEELLVRWRRKDGELITVRLNGIALRDDSGELIGFDIVAEDVTQQRETEMQLRQAQKMQAVGRLTGGIAHDFNNVLTAILGSAELLRQDLHQSASPEVLDGVETIVSASQRAARMVRKLMAFSRQEQLVRKIIDLGETCRETLELLRRLLPESVALKADL
ncbi:MAG: PAS domain S-box protein, partial [Gemmatimonadales bacterium]